LENLMKLYYTPGACSLASHIALIEAGLTFDLDKVDLRAKKTSDGGDYLTVSSKGYVPALRLDDGSVLTEGTAIMPYIADRNPASNLAPAAGTIERYRLQEWLGYINSELHKSFGPLFYPATPEEQKTATKALIGKKLDWLQQQLDGKDFLMGSQFTVADAYLFTVLSWTNIVKIDLAQWPKLKAYSDRIATRPAVQAALRAEGLLK
jgi:glutathione S-transferase